MMNWRKDTLSFYNQNSDEFVSGTLAADMSDARSRFVSRLPLKALILDFGCGSGRDTKAFLDAGYQVEATDGSEELCERASAYTGIQVKRMLFQDLDAVDRYDGIWACASVLHLPAEELKTVIGKIAVALKRNGVLYVSFKYGEYEGMRKGRYFTDFTEEKLRTFWESFPSLQIVETWITEDVRPDRKDEKWISLLARRV